MKTKKKYFSEGVIIICLLMAFSANAQVKVGDNPTNVNPDAVLEIESTDKGLLLPRMALTATTATAPLSAHVAGMTVYNTATAGDVTPGYYYNDGTRWVRLTTENDLKTEPWFDQLTNTEATDNAQDIYQGGNVAIGKTSNHGGTALDVEGAVRGGANQTGSVGANSVAFGDGNIASGFNAVAFGVGNTASAEGAVTLGAENEVTGLYGQAYGYGNVVSSSSIAIGEENNVLSTSSLVAGRNNQVEGNTSFILGQGNTVTSNANFISVSLGAGNVMDSSGFTLGELNTLTENASNSVVLGYENISANAMETVLGHHNAITTNILNPDDRPLLQVGNGVNAGARTNALTILNNGNIGTDLAIAPTERLDIGSGNVRVRDIFASAGDLDEDRVVVADADGVLRTLDVDELAIEPWQIQGTTDKATENDQNIYQMGSVSILKDQVRVAALALDVFGPVSFGGTHTGAAGINSVILGGNNNMASGTNAVAGGENARAMGNFSFAFGPGSDALGHNTTNFGQNSSATALSANSFIAGGTGNTTSAINTFATGLTSTASGQHSFAAGSLSIASSQSEAVIGRANAITTGDASAIVATDAIFQVGIGGTAATRRNAMTVLKNGNIGVGIIGTEAAAKPTERLDIGSAGVRIRAINTVPYNGNLETDRVVVADTDGVLKTVDAGPLSANIYNSDGLLTGSEISRNLTLNGKELNFIGTSQQTSWTPGGVLYQENLAGAGGQAAMMFSAGNSSNLSIQQFHSGDAQIFATDNSTSFRIGTHGSTNSAPIAFVTSEGGGALGTEKMRITGEGEIWFANYPNTRDDSGTTSVQNVLYTDANGNVLSASAASVVAEPWFDQATNTQATLNTQDIYQMGKVGIGTDDMLGTTNPNVILALNGAMLTTTSIYADYVFEDYFEGSSELNTDYSFKSLSEVEKFINENRHLPGIAKIDALMKNEKGDYIINPTELSVQVLEKVEELFLYTIEQQKLLEEKDKKIQELETRLERLEKILLEDKN